jgi:hypothetical protein
MKTSFYFCIALVPYVEKYAKSFSQVLFSTKVVQVFSI